MSNTKQKNGEKHGQTLQTNILKKATKLNDKDVYAALGWLAREDKIYFVETESELIVGLA